MRLARFLAAMLVVVGIATAAVGWGDVAKPNTEVVKVKPHKMRKSCPRHQRAISFYRGKARHYGKPFGTKLPEREWKMTCAAAERRAAEWRLKAQQARVRHERYVIPPTGNWVRAMRYAQRPFPGTRAWLEYISNRECRACWTTPGGFVCNYGGSGACGPMQFMRGTFYGHADDAKAAVARAGYVVHPATWDWHNALGQALTAAYMRYTGQDGCHWCL